MALERQYQGKSKRESRGMNKKLIDIDADSNHNDAITGKRSIHQNRKLSTWIGSQWSQKELKHFYEAYRKYGKNWQKVAGVVRSRSKEMVEALYNKNRAYLSLPEGAATVVGLIAMMTDHYNILGGRELESNDESVLFHSQSAASSHGRLYLLKEGQSDGSISRRRRTPRVLVSYLNEKGHVEKCASPNNREPKCTADVGKLAPEAMSTLPEALLKEGSLDVPQTHMKSSPVRNGEEMHLEPEVVSAKLIGMVMADVCSESTSKKQGQYRDKDFTRDTSDMMKTDGVDSLDIHKNLKKFQGKKPKLQDTENNNFDYFKRMSSASAGLDLLSSVCLKSESDVTLKKAEECIDSFPHFKEKKRESDIIDKANISEPEVMFADDGVNKHKRSDAKEIGYEAVAIPKSSVLATDKLGIDLTLGLGVSEVKHELPLAARKMTKRKHDALVSEIPTVESVSDSLPNKYMKTQDSSSALLNPRQHNTNQENSPSLCLKPVASSASPAAPLNFFDCSVPPAQESELTEVKVFETSQLRACRMIDLAIQVASSLKKGEGAFEKIRNALEAANTSNSREECGISATRFSVPSDTSRHNLSYQYQTTSCTSAPTTTTAIDTTGSELHSTPEQIEMPIPSALISSCVATLLMIQTCTDRRYPPAEVAQILDSAARSLRPCCSENLPIYRDIQMCMGMVKNQMLALIPTT